LINILVVDDEITTRNGLIKHIPWKELGVDQIEEAVDGLDALEKLNHFHPDIVLSDIRMPGIDGIELSARIKKQFPDCKLIFISGYSDKEYLKAAINLSVVGYVEKPINPSEVKEVVQKAIALCKEDEKKRIAEKNVSEVVAENLPFIKQKIALGMIEQKQDQDEIKKNVDLLNIRFDNNDRFNVMLIRIADGKEPDMQANQNNMDFVSGIVDNCLAGFRHISTSKDASHILIVLSCNTADYNKIISDIFENVKENLKKSNRQDIRLFCGVSQSVTGIDKIPFAYQNAVMVLQKLFYYGFDRIVFYERSYSEPFEPDNDIFEKFALLLKEQKEKETILLIENLCRDIKNHDTTLVNNVKNVFFKLTLELFRESEKRGIFFNEAGDNEEKYLWDLISNFLTLEDIRNYLINKITFIFKGINELESCNRTVFEVRKFIQKNFDDENLSATALAEHVYLTPTYLSSMFKKSTGKTISEYIIEVRIEKSKDFLMDSQMKLYEVARKVGYNDPNYYAKVFKRLVGYTPSEYREKYLL